MNTAAYSAATAVLQLTDAQLAQQTDLVRRLVNMTYLGTPRVESQDPNMPALLALHVLASALLYVAEHNQGITESSS